MIRLATKILEAVLQAASLWDRMRKREEAENDAKRRKQAMDAIRDSTASRFNRVYGGKGDT